jgi:hypothetical protein
MMLGILDVGLRQYWIKNKTLKLKGDCMIIDDEIIEPLHPIPGGESLPLPVISIPSLMAGIIPPEIVPTIFIPVVFFLEITTININIMTQITEKIIETYQIPLNKT